MIFSPMITYGKDKKILINDNGELKYIDVNNKNSTKKLDKPVVVNHKGQNKILAVKEQPFMININKIDTDKLYSETIKQDSKISNTLETKNPNKEINKNNITILKLS
ncbi:MAG: hypothetical protein U0354_09195 [Candidatus Sericytochromatia bacterium]